MKEGIFALKTQFMGYKIATYLFFILAGPVSVPLAAQDYIVTWKNDTLPCVFPDKPGKEGFRPVAKFENGHIRVLTYFPNDSVRAIEAGHIRSYSRAKHGRGLLCNGVFDAKMIGDKEKTIADPTRFRADNNWYFMRRVEEGPFATLYIVYTYSGRRISYSYFISRKEDDPDKAILLLGRKHTVRLLSEDEAARSLKNFKYKNSAKGYREIVKEYNRLKGAVAASK